MLRGGEPPDDAGVVVRGGEHGFHEDVLRRTAQRTFEDYGFYGVSVFVALDGAVERLCVEVDEVRRYGQIRLSTVGRLRRAGFTLLSTGRTPHFDIALPDASGPMLRQLRVAFDPPTPNPGR